MVVFLNEMKNYLRVDFDDDDMLLRNIMESAQQLCMDVARMDDEDAFDYRIIREGENLNLARNPEQNFEDSYFQLAKAGNSSYAGGSFDSKNVWNDFGLSGTVQNNSGFDFSFFAVIAGENLYVFEGLPAGETADLSEHSFCYLGTDYENSFNRYQYDYVSDFYARDDIDEISAAAALGIGIYDVYARTKGNDLVLIGLIEDAEKVVDDNCNEVAYKCVYQVQ